MLRTSLVIPTTFSPPDGQSSAAWEDLAGWGVLPIIPTRPCSRDSRPQHFGRFSSSGGWIHYAPYGDDPRPARPGPAIRMAPIHPDEAVAGGRAAGHHGGRGDAPDRQRRQPLPRRRE